MKKIATAVLAGAAALMLASCTTVSPVAGATGKVGSKTGEAKQAFFSIFPLKGEGGVQMAAKNGGIKKVGTVDMRINWPASPIIPFCTVTTVVSGD